MPRKNLILVALAMMLIIVGCSAPEPTGISIPEPANTPQSTDTPELTNAPSATPSPRPVGDIGWRQVTGVVYAGAQAAGNELPGALVRCSHHSYSAPPETSCAPYRITTASDGTFEFDVFVHDTDGITISAEKAGYQPDKHLVGGFDCVGACPHVALVLEMGD
jgi:hypothetical protein